MAATGAYRRPAASKNEREVLPADLNIPDNYVQHTLETTKPLPPVTLKNWWKELNYLNCVLVGVTPLIALYGAFTTKLQWQTALFSVFWYFVTGLGITAGYHRLWAHRSYNASKPLEYALAMAGAGAVQGSIKWWSRGHRAHHRYTDTDLDPYGAHHGLIWSHIGWMVFKPRRKPGVADTPFDDKHTPRDHLITALVTIGEGYHNFHHQFPMDYRNAIKWYQYDPTKWFITAMSWLGLASHLKVFPDNEVQKGQMTMQLKKIKALSDKIEWPKSSNDLPVISWHEFQALAKERNLILISGFIHDVSSFLEEHPGGKHLLAKMIGKDATTAFFGGVYDHSNAAHNLLAMMRVGVLHGGLELESEKAVPPSQKIRVVSHAEFTSLSAPNGPEDSFSTRPRPASPLSDLGSDQGLASSPSSGGEEDDMPKTPTAELSFELPSTSKA
ncbi:hypothetical protein FRC11_006317 [Ceratobasidium sp. 423]|nr:hypothetical protein FRC11_006317 [Ceratobasidium sp. 423]